MEEDRFGTTLARRPQAIVCAFCGGDHGGEITPAVSQECAARELAKTRQQRPGSNPAIEADAARQDTARRTRAGSQLRTGDIVTVRCRVIELLDTDGLDVVLETTVPGPFGLIKPTLLLSSRQCERMA